MSPGFVYYCQYFEKGLRSSKKETKLRTTLRSNGFRYILGISPGKEKVEK